MSVIEKKVYEPSHFGKKSITAMIMSASIAMLKREKIGNIAIKHKLFLLSIEGM